MVSRPARGADNPEYGGKRRKNFLYLEAKSLRLLARMAKGTMVTERMEVWDERNYCTGYVLMEKL